MTEDTRPTDTRPFADPEPIDSQLAYLCEIAQHVEGFRFSLSLDMHGTVVSGDLVGRNEWFELFAQKMSETGESGTHVGEALAEMGTHTAEQLESEEAVDDYFIHFVNAHRAVAQGARREDGGDSGLLWRGRIGSVDGWSLGYMSETTSV